jgi:protein phosphatase PTC7
VGVDPSEFAWGIMNQSKNQIDHHQKEDLLEILSEGYKTLKDKKLVKAGSSTIALLSVELGKAKVLNLGDSGFRLFRDNKLIYRTHEQQYFFNAPYQLSILLESDSKKGSLQTQPDQSFRDEITLEDKDILLLGTDGLFDNLGDEKLVEIIKTENSLENKIDLMLKTALAASRGTVDTPFSKNARAAGYRFGGGKEDDITILLAQYTESIASKL